MSIEHSYCLYHDPQVKIWFQNRRTKWKKQENISSAEVAEHKLNAEKNVLKAKNRKYDDRVTVGAHDRRWICDILNLIETTVHNILATQRKFIGNPETHAAHLPAISEDKVQSAYWHAACGWPYGRRNHIGLAKVTSQWHLCKKCIKAKAYYNQIDGEDE